MEKQFALSILHFLLPLYINFFFIISNKSKIDDRKNTNVKIDLVNPSTRIEEIIEKSKKIANLESSSKFILFKENIKLRINEEIGIHFPLQSSNRHTLNLIEQETKKIIPERRKLPELPPSIQSKQKIKENPAKSKSIIKKNPIKKTPIKKFVKRSLPSGPKNTSDTIPTNITLTTENPKKNVETLPERPQRNLPPKKKEVNLKKSAEKNFKNMKKNFHQNKKSFNTKIVKNNNLAIKNTAPIKRSSNNLVKKSPQKIVGKKEISFPSNENNFTEKKVFVSPPTLVSTSHVDIPPPNQKNINSVVDVHNSPNNQNIGNFFSSSDKNSNPSLSPRVKNDKISSPFNHKNIDKNTFNSPNQIDENQDLLSPKNVRFQVSSQPQNTENVKKNEWVRNKNSENLFSSDKKNEKYLSPSSSPSLFRSEGITKTPPQIGVHSFDTTSPRNRKITLKQNVHLQDSKINETNEDSYVDVGNSFDCKSFISPIKQYSRNSEIDDFLKDLQGEEFDYQSIMLTSTFVYQESVEENIDQDFFDQIIKVLDNK